VFCLGRNYLQQQPEANFNVCVCVIKLAYNIIAKGTGSIFISSIKNIVCVNM